MPASLINSIKDIDNKRYLELGVFDGHHFNTISAKDKVSVDIGHSPTHKMPTDQFFIQVANTSVWDVIYIDADHSCQSINADFNNAIAHLNLNGFVFLHDLFPQSADLCQPQFCGTGYIFLDALLRNKYDHIYTSSEDYGVTMIYNPQLRIDATDLELNLSYEEFRKRWNKYKLYTIEEMEIILKESYNE
jgi:hypothetical protein